MKAIINDVNQISVLGYGETEEAARHSAAALIAHRGGAAAWNEWHYSEEPGYQGGVLVDVDSVLADALINTPHYSYKLKLVDTSYGVILMIDTAFPKQDNTPSDSGVITVFGRSYQYVVLEAGFAGKPDSLYVAISTDGKTLSHSYVDTDISSSSVTKAAKMLVAEYEGRLARMAAEDELGLTEEIDYS